MEMHFVDLIRNIIIFDWTIKICPRRNDENIVFYNSVICVLRYSDVS